jgi:ATP/maltotriose-dependent transcriptional regulator MalT
VQIASDPQTLVGTRFQMFLHLRSEISNARMIEKPQQNLRGTTCTSHRTTWSGRKLGALSVEEVTPFRSICRFHSQRERGCSNKIVADRLSISEETVKSHMKSIVAKLKANNRTHAVLIAKKRGFLES